MALTVQESVKTPEEIDLCHECTGCGLHFENKKKKKKLNLIKNLRLLIKWKMKT